MKIFLPLPSDFSLRSTVLSHGWFQTEPFAWEEATETLRRVDRLRPGGRAHVVTLREHEGQLAVEISGARNIPPSFVTRIRRMLQLDQDRSAFFRAIRDVPHLRWVRRGKYGRVLRGGSLFEDVTKAICGTNIQWNQAVAMANRISTLGPVAPGTPLHAFPSPHEVRAAGEKWLRERARAGYRAGYIVALAESMDSGGCGLESLEEEAPSMTGETLRKRILRIRGIGPATARYLGAFLGKFDAVMVDSSVIAYARRTYFSRKRTVRAKEIERHYAAYGEWCGLVTWLEVWGDYCARNGIRL